VATNFKVGDKVRRNDDCSRGGQEGVIIKIKQDFSIRNVLTVRKEIKND